MAAQGVGPKSRDVEAKLHNQVKQPTSSRGIFASGVWRETHLQNPVNASNHAVSAMAHSAAQSASFSAFSRDISYVCCVFFPPSVPSFERCACMCGARPSGAAPGAESLAGVCA